MPEKDVGKVYHVVITDTIGLSDSIGLSKDTIESAFAATGSLAKYTHYYQEAFKIVEKASIAGSMNASDISTLQKTLGEWHKWNEEWNTNIIELTRKNESEKLKTIDKSINEKIPEMLRMITVIYDKTAGPKAWNQIEGFFNVKSSDKEKTTVFKGTSHSDLLELLLKWIETKNGEVKLFGQIIHGPRESGIDIIAQTSEGNEKVGIQLKNNDDVKAEDFTTKIKAQVTDSRKHQLRGLVVIFAANMTDNSIEAKVRGIVSEFSQMKETLIKVVPPENTFTIIDEIITRATL